MATIIAERRLFYRVTSDKQERWLASFMEALRLYKQWSQQYGIASLFKEIMIDYKKYADHTRTILLYQISRGA